MSFLKKSLCIAAAIALLFSTLIACSAQNSNANVQPETSIHEYAWQPRVFALAVVLLIGMVLVLVFLRRKHRLGLKLENKVQGRTHELEFKNNMIESIFNSIPDLIFCKDVNLNFTLCNKSFERYLGVKESDILGKNDLRALGISADKVEEYNKSDLKVMQVKQPLLFEQNIPRHDGVLVSFETIKVPLFDNGKVVGVMGVSHDVSTRIKMEEATKAALKAAEEASNAKSSFLAHMSHEIRTPMNAVIGLSELMLGEKGLSPEAKENIEKIQGAGATILSIVNDILDISKIESGKVELYPTKYDTPSLINDIVAQNILRIGEKPIAFNLEVDERLPSSLFGDDLRIKQVFNNLLSNAFKYTNSGSVSWEITFEQAGDDVWLISSIKDTGIGMRPASVERLFSEYNQVDTRANRKVEGTGLGLSIAKSMIDMMDGSISVQSEYGVGSIFTVRIRQGFVSETEIGSEVAKNLMDMRRGILDHGAAKELTRIDLSYARVLVVDDISTNIDVAKGMLSPYGMRVDGVLSGYEAIERVRCAKPHYDAIFMDHMMPEMDGIETARIIREELGTDYASNIPIIALTANAIVGNEEMFLERGFEDFISKPISIKKLDAVLRKWVRNKELEVEFVESLEGGEKKVLADTRHEGFAAAAIDGLNLDKALQYFDGNQEVLMGVLRSYALNTRPLLQRLQEDLLSKNLSDYAITAHGIKGSSYSILANDIGAVAEYLEKAAREQDIVAIKAVHVGFIKDIGTLLESITRFLKQLDRCSAKPLAARPDQVLLDDLRAACEMFDISKVNTTMAALEALRYDSGESLIAWLRKRIDDMDFEEVAKGEWPDLH